MAPQNEAPQTGTLSPSHRRPKRRTLILGSALALIVLGGLGWLAWDLTHSDAASGTSRPVGGGTRAGAAAGTSAPGVASHRRGGNASVESLPRRPGQLHRSGCRASDSVERATGSGATASRSADNGGGADSVISGRLAERRCIALSADNKKPPQPEAA